MRARGNKTLQNAGKVLYNAKYKMGRCTHRPDYRVERGMMHMGTKRRRRRFLTPAAALRLVIAAVCVYLLVALICVQMDIVSKRQQLDNITAQVQAQQAANQELQRTVDAGDEAAYMERVARDKLGYAYPGEKVYIDMAGQ